jgi:hypothetical protein
MKKLEDIISDLRVELEFLGENYNVPLAVLSQSVDSLEELLRNEITTPFSDDLGTEDDYCYPRELGEVHDTFNVVIQGSGNPITLTRQVIRSSQDDGSYLQSMVDVLSKLRN